MASTAFAATGLNFKELAAVSALTMSFSDQSLIRRLVVFATECRIFPQVLGRTMFTPLNTELNCLTCV